ncbi:hypothetical protein [Streptomyces sp. NPDC001604]|uniref:MmyB family transcriptional regulator n=1 Tax=Streptomyces sp. NPDC001604 TaxID=3364593 RepID=UPI0036B5C394
MTSGATGDVGSRSARDAGTCSGSSTRCRTASRTWCGSCSATRPPARSTPSGTPTQDIVASLRRAAGRHHHDPLLAGRVGELSIANEAFRHWWADQNVYRHTHGSEHFHPPIVGPLTLKCGSRTMPADPGQRPSVYSAEAGSSSGEALRTAWIRHPKTSRGQQGEAGAWSSDQNGVIRAPDAGVCSTSAAAVLSESTRHACRGPLRAHRPAPLAMWVVDLWRRAGGRACVDNPVVDGGVCGEGRGFGHGGVCGGCVGGAMAAAWCGGGGPRGDRGVAGRGDARGSGAPGAL